MSRFRFSSAAAVLIACLLSVQSDNAASPLAARTADHVQTSAAALSRANVRAFDEAWAQVRDKFYDPKLNGLDWNAIGRKYRPLAADANGDAARVINQMLAELRSSHTGYYTPDEIAYYDLADIFSGGLRDDLPKRFAKGEVAYSGIGMITRVMDGRHFISGILAGFPADKAGLVVGDEILGADGAAFEPVGSFAGKAGRKVRLTIRREAGGEPQTIDVVPQMLHPNEAFLKAMEDGARLIERDNRKLGYVHIWSYARQRYQELLENLISDGKLKDADALIWDLRDGWGGAEPQYLDIFNGRSPTMKLIGRDGAETVNARWRKPVILIINGGTRSGKEVLAYGFKKYGYGEVVGTKSAGAVLAARAFMQTNGNLLLLAVTDVTVDNERLEGVGVAPDHEVPFDIRYAKGADPQLAAAIDILMRKLD